jgi:hypothetical protein
VTTALRFNGSKNIYVKLIRDMCLSRQISYSLSSVIIIIVVVVVVIVIIIIIIIII